MKNLGTKLSLALGTLMFAAPALAQEAGHMASSSDGLKFLGAGIAISISVLGGALGQGKAAAAALDGIARNPAASGKILVPMILGLALIESLVIYALIIALRLA